MSKLSERIADAAQTVNDAWRVRLQAWAREAAELERQVAEVAELADACARNMSEAERQAERVQALEAEVRGLSRELQAWERMDP